MSNPAVIKLQSGTVGNSRVWLDDNIGESIHIHIDDLRVDLSVAEFQKMYADLCLTVNELVDVDGFDMRKIDPVFFSVMLWPKISKLKSVSIDTVRLGEMLAPVNYRILPLPDSMGVKALRGLSHENNAVVRKSHHICQSDDERMALILESIKEHGYPYLDNYIIMFGDDTVIRDGQHRASCLYYLYGDIEVPVLRLYFSDYVSPRIDRFYNCRLRVLLRRTDFGALRTTAMSVLRLAKRIAGRLIRFLRPERKQRAGGEELLSFFHSR